MFLYCLALGPGGVGGPDACCVIWKSGVVTPETTDGRPIPGHR
jgi:hypothetical protein